MEYTVRVCEWCGYEEKKVGASDPISVTARKTPAGSYAWYFVGQEQICAECHAAWDNAKAAAFEHVKQTRQAYYGASGASPS